jgi:tetrapyrrole methylase family protein / MazG family protein
MNKPPAERRAFGALVEIVKTLRGPTGCPWDKEQTHKTLTRFAIEEAHELAEAIDHGDTPHVIEELGDLLLQVVLHAEIARQEGSFTLEDVIEGISDKMVRRHPHVFGDVNLESSEAVLTQWSEIKAKEKAPSKKKKKNSFDLPPNMPALMMSQKIGEKTRKVDFDFTDLRQAFSKVKEEVLEMEKAIVSGDKAAMVHELGDIFFSAAQVARFCESDAEQIARLSNQRFEKRFFKMKELATGDFKKLPPAEKERLWQAAKKATK